MSDAEQAEIARSRMVPIVADTLARSLAARIPLAACRMISDLDILQTADEIVRALQMQGYCLDADRQEWARWVASTMNCGSG